MTNKKIVVTALLNLQQAAYFSNYLIAMKNDNIVSKRTSKEVLSESFLEEVYDIQDKLMFYIKMIIR